MGAVPLYLAAGFILEEGFPLADLARIVESMAAAAQEAGVPVVTGDTKVVERARPMVSSSPPRAWAWCPGVNISGDRARPGRPHPGQRHAGRPRRGDHVAAREPQLRHQHRSDTAALHGLVAAMVAGGAGIHCLRDPTRGGLATTLNESPAVGLSAWSSTKAIPVQAQVAAACEFLGLDPLYVANEGKLVAICAPEERRTLLQTMRAHPLGPKRLRSSAR
jgi:hydrogenase expression/formation protein HypE